MQIAKALISFGLRQVVGIAIDQFVAAVADRFSDPSQVLPQALGPAGRVRDGSPAAEVGRGEDESQSRVAIRRVRPRRIPGDPGPVAGRMEAPAVPRADHPVEMVSCTTRSFSLADLPRP